MEPGFLELLRSRAAEIHVRWEELLQLDSLSGILGDESAFTQLIPFTIACVLIEIARQAVMAKRRGGCPNCICGHSPYLRYYKAGEQAFAEVVVLLQANRGRKRRRPGEELDLVLSSFRQVAQHAMENHCSTCIYRVPPFGSPPDSADGPDPHPAA